MIFHDEHTMTIRRIQRMFSTKNPRLVLTGKWFDFLVPRYFVRRKYVEFMKFFDTIFGNGMDKEFKQHTLRTLLYNKIENILKVTRHLLLTSDSQLARDTFRYYYGKDYEGPEDIAKIDLEIKSLTKRFRLLFESKPSEEVSEEEVSFESIIQSVEVVLGMRYMPRDTTLFEFTGYYDQARKILAKNKK